MKWNKSVGKYNLTQLNPIQIESLNRVISIGKKIEEVVKGSLQKKHQ